MGATYDISGVEYLGGHRLRLTFGDGGVGDIDLTWKFDGPVGPIFEPLRDFEELAKVSVDPGLGTITWPNGADLAPDVLHDEAVAAS